jgi:protein phosphatase
MKNEKNEKTNRSISGASIMELESQKDTAELDVPQGAAPRRPRVPSAQVAVDLGALSHRGKVRPQNEDHYLVARFGRSLETLLSNIPEEEIPPAHVETGYGMVIADGMGGMAGGEVASRSAIQDLVALALSTPDWIFYDRSPRLEEVMKRMGDRFREIDRLLNERAAANPRLTGMGTTMTFACSLGLDLILCHIGDTRAYLLRQGRLAQLTCDMTMAHELVKAGMLEPAKVATHRFRHVLTQALGGPGVPKAEVKHLALEVGDHLLLCSDGLFDLVPDDAIAAILGAAATSQEACQTLVDRALDAGGKDNVTVILARYRHAAMEPSASA